MPFDYLNEREETKFYLCETNIYIKGRKIVFERTETLISFDDNLEIE